MKINTTLLLLSIISITYVTITILQPKKDNTTFTCYNPSYLKEGLDSSTQNKLITYSCNYKGSITILTVITPKADRLTRQ